METNSSENKHQLLTFTLGAETFAADISKIREVLELTTVTKVPQVPEMMLGVINLRGSVVPVIDLRVKFELGRVEATVNTCIIIIIEVASKIGIFMIGALVDSVREVLELNDDQIEPVPKVMSHLNTDAIIGMGKVNDQFLIILDVEQIFSADDAMLESIEEHHIEQTAAKSAD